MSQTNLSTLVELLLSTGGGAFGLAIFKGWADMRSGSRAEQREVVNDLVQWCDELDRRLQTSYADRDYWRDIAAQRGHQLREEAGIVPYITELLPPSERPKRIGFRRIGP